MNSASASSLSAPRTVEIVAARRVAIHQVLFVFSRVPRQAARNGPHAAGVEHFEQTRVRHEPRHAPVPVRERVNPEQTVMRRRRRKDRFRAAERAVDLLKPRHEPRHGAGADRKVPSDLHVIAAQLSRHDIHRPPAVRVGNHQQLFRQQLAEAPMNLADRSDRRRATFYAALVDPALHGDVRPCFKLQVALFGIAAVVVLHRTLDVDRVRVVPFDQVGVVAVHRADEVRQRPDDSWRQTAPESRRRGGELDREIAHRPR